MNIRPWAHLITVLALLASLFFQNRTIATYRSQVSILIASSEKLIKANDELRAADKSLKEDDARLKYAAERVKAFCAEKGVKLR